MKRFFVSVAASAAFCFSAMADTAGTVTQTVEKGPIVKYIFDWHTGMSNQSAIATGTIYVRGELLRVVFNPLTATRPTAAYTITMADSYGVDLLAGGGAALTTGTVTSVRPGCLVVGGAQTNSVPFVLNDLISVTVTNGGTNRSGQVILYTR